LVFFFPLCTHPPAVCFERIQGMEGVFWH
jgi:hypothetical protein